MSWRVHSQLNVADVYAPASAELQADRDVVLAAAAHGGYCALLYASAELRTELRTEFGGVVAHESLDGNLSTCHRDAERIDVSYVQSRESCLRRGLSVSLGTCREPHCKRGCTFRLR